MCARYGCRGCFRGWAGRQGLIVARKAERCYNDVWDLVCRVENLYCGCEGIEIGDGGFREKSRQSTSIQTSCSAYSLGLELVGQYQICLS